MATVLGFGAGERAGGYVLAMMVLVVVALGGAVVSGFLPHKRPDAVPAAA